MRSTLLWTWWVVFWALVDYTETRRTIGCLIDTVVQTLYVSGTNSNVNTTSYVNTSLAVYPGSNNHVNMCNLVHGNMLSLSSKKERSSKVSLKTGIIEIDNKMTINMLMKYFYIAARYFYITNWLISGDINKVIYKPTEAMKSDYVTEALQGKLFNINKTELMNVYVIKSIKSKLVRL